MKWSNWRKTAFHLFTLFLLIRYLIEIFIEIEFISRNNRAAWVFLYVRYDRNEKIQKKTLIKTMEISEWLRFKNMINWRSAEISSVGESDAKWRSAKNNYTFSDNSRRKKKRLRYERQKSNKYCNWRKSSNLQRSINYWRIFNWVTYPL